MRDAEYDYGLAPGERFEPDEGMDEPFDPTRPHVMTALGPVDPGALGFTLPNEHVITRPPSAELDRQLDNVTLAVAELEGFSLTGGRALVDLTTADRGRSLEDILWVAQRVPVHLILATGLLGNHSAFPMGRERSIDQTVEWMTAELTDGIEGTGARAGVIVVGTASGEVAQAAAITHHATVAPISVQPQGITEVIELLRYFREAGVDMRHVIVGPEAQRWRDDQARWLLETGAFVVISHWTQPVQRTESRVALVKAMFDAGFGEQILLSGNFARRSDWLAYDGGPGFVHFIDFVPLALMEAGLNARTVRQIFVDNPARALTRAHVQPT